MAREPCPCRGRYGNACTCGGTGYRTVKAQGKKDTEVYKPYVRPKKDPDEAEAKDETTTES